MSTPVIVVIYNYQKLQALSEHVTMATVEATWFILIDFFLMTAVAFFSLNKFPYEFGLYKKGIIFSVF